MVQGGILPEQETQLYGNWVKEPRAFAPVRAGGLGAWEHVMQLQVSALLFCEARGPGPVWPSAESGQTRSGAGNRCPDNSNIKVLTSCD